MLRISSYFLPLLLVATLSQPAGAEVIYTWRQAQAAPSMPPGLNVELVFSDAAVAKGGLYLEFENLCMGEEPCLDPQDSLLSLRYWYDGMWPDGSQAEWNLIHYDYRGYPRYWSDYIFMDIVFRPDGRLDGTIRANDSNSDFLMQSSGGLFTMLEAHSDEYFGCGEVYPECHGSRGLLLDARIDTPVTEPPLMALGAIGMLGAWFARRRPRSRSASRR
ncbi:PEP-CTERM sorting domain-containing protein [Massilia sp. ST3]|uniref:PEP-CTERM sorting domain-containing protein n=1 Tax=Massilia sp. ST3 TaxID=2824903 RepID=UPI001B82E522|nr:PEP-CTERM sorting domain-containing protein [Massilia sp. ST3]MBQ5946697.1 PEP-CTERM sorting domain-containing protein [Massilia sp. ST3]